MSSPLLDNLNPEQLAAVTLPHQSALILAGAGSGKTRVLTTRIAWLIATQRAHPGSILAVTFTNKAAKEMLTRISAMTPLYTRGMWIGTFHGLCNRLLRMHHREADLPPLFQIMDTQDQLALIKRVYRAHNINDDDFPHRELQQFIGRAKEEGRRPNQVEADNDLGRRQVEHYALYEEACRREGVVDFAELLLRSYELLAGNEALRGHYRRRLAHLLVDEFQDTNVLQYRWLQLLAGPQTAVFAVGDDDQSIYAFRGANVANMQSFERDFSRPELPVRVVKLEQNYRSHGNILAAANALIEHNRTRLGKNLWTSDGKGEPLRGFTAPTDIDEAAFVIDMVRALGSGRDGGGVPLSDIAVLYRSNAQSRVLEHALFNAAVPYRVYGGMRFFERAEIKNALAYLRLVATPDDDGAFLRIVNFPPRGIGARTLETLQDHARRDGVSLWQAACAGSVSGKPGSSLAAFVQLIDAMRTSTAGLALPDTVERINAASGLAAHYATERDGSERIANLKELVSAARSFLREIEFTGSTDIASTVPADAEAAAAGAGTHGTASTGIASTDIEAAAASASTYGTAPAGVSSGDAVAVTAAADGQSPATAMDPMTAFLSHAALEAGETQAAAGRPALQLMTVHSAKGLEFHTVFVTGLEEGLFPHENSRNEAESLEEERRLMYVAITRARRRVYLTQTQSRMLHGQVRYNVASRFFDELPEETLQWLSPRRRAVQVDRGDRGERDRFRGSSLPPPAFAGSARGSGSPWRIGQSVRHTKFGVGVIIDAEGRGADARVQVNFRDAGVKWLALEYAKLEAA